MTVRLPHPYIANPNEDEAQRLRKIQDNLDALAQLTPINTERLRDGAVTSAKVGAGVPTSVEDVRIVRGIINTTTPSIDAGSGFTVSRNGTGDVTISYSTAFSAVPSVSADIATDVLGRQAQLAQSSNNTASQTRVRTVDGANAATEAIFHFIAIGPR